MSSQHALTTAPVEGIRIASPREAARRILQLLVVWQSRQQQRYHLADLPAYRLRDVGLSSVEVARESGKRFWQA